MPEKSSSIPIKKALGAILFVVGIGVFIEFELIFQWEWWNEILGIIMFISAYFLIIAGRQLE